MRDLPANTRHTLRLLPLWAVPGNAALYYLALYMKGNGLGTLSIGVVLSANLYLALVFQLVAGGVINRLGRKQTTVVFYFTSWIFPMFIWSVAHDFWLFLVAYLLNASSKIIDISFSLLAIDDATEQQRPRIYAAMKLIITAAGLLTPLVGVSMEHFGSVSALRVVYFVGGVSMLVHVLWYRRVTTETGAGRTAMEAHDGTGVLRSIGPNLRLFARACRSPLLLPLIGLYILTSVGWQLNVFQAVYLSEALDFSDRVISLFPAFGAAVSLLCYFLVMPRLRSTSSERYMVAALLLNVLGWSVFLTVSRGTLTLLLVSAALTAAGHFLTEAYRDAILVGRVAAEDRAGMFSVVQGSAAVAAIPCGYVAAVLYETRPLLLFVVILATYVGGSVCALLLLRTGRSGAVAEAAATCDPKEAAGAE